MNPTDVEEWIKQNMDNDECDHIEPTTPTEEIAPTKDEYPFVARPDFIEIVSGVVEGIVSSHYENTTCQIIDVTEAQDHLHNQTVKRVRKLMATIDVLQKSVSGYDDNVLRLESKNDELRTEIDALHVRYEEFETNMAATHHKNITFFENAITKATQEMQETKERTNFLQEDVRKTAANLHDTQKRIDIMTDCMSDIDEKGKTTSGREYKRSVNNIIEYTKTRLNGV